MASDWRDVSLDELVEVKHGFAFSGEFFRDDPPGDVLLTPGNFAIGGGFKADKLKYYSGGSVPEEFVLTAGDLLVTMTDLSKESDTLGYPAFVPSSSPAEIRYLHNQRLGKVLIKSDAPIDKRFLFYLLCSREYRNEVMASATGTTVKHTSPTRIGAFRFKLPEMIDQQAIARVLGTLDDKIELNSRLNEMLEGMAHALFKSWFIDFDPVRAKSEGCEPGVSQSLADLFPDSFEDSPIGEIPKGWRAVPLPDAIEVNPTRMLHRGAVAPYLDMSNMPTRGHSPNFVTNRAFGSGMRFANGDTLVARITPCLENGKAAFVDFLQPGQVGWGSTEYIVLRSKQPLPDEYAYCLVRSLPFREFAIPSMTGTSGRQRVPVEALGHLRTVVPTDEVSSKFGEFAGSFFKRAKALSDESKLLAALRNTLLPKLISGELRLSAPERIAGGQM